MKYTDKKLIKFACFLISMILYVASCTGSNELNSRYRYAGNSNKKIYIKKKLKKSTRRCNKYDISSTLYNTINSSQNIINRNFYHKYTQDRCSDGLEYLQCLIGTFFTMAVIGFLGRYYFKNFGNKGKSTKKKIRKAKSKSTSNKVKTKNTDRGINNDLRNKHNNSTQRSLNSNDTNNTTAKINKIDLSYQKKTNEEKEKIAKQTLENKGIGCHKVIIGDTNQYNNNGKRTEGGCTMFALEFAINLAIYSIDNKAIDKGIINNAVDMICKFKCDKHTAFEDVVEGNKITRYNKYIEMIESSENLLTNDFTSLLNKLDELSKNNQPIHVLLTKPPESIYIGKYKKCYFFADSHPQPEKDLPQAYILLFKKRSDLKAYLESKFSYLNLGHDYDDLRAQQINMYDACFFKTNKVTQSSSSLTEKEDILFKEELIKIGAILNDQFHKNNGIVN